MARTFSMVRRHHSGPEWRVDETAQSLIAAGKIEPLVIVGNLQYRHQPHQ